MSSSDLWRCDGTLDRGRYALLGTVLFAVKHNLDRLIAAWFGRPWRPFNYLAPGGLLTSLSGADAKFYAVLIGTALPFIWAGVALTLRRLRAAGLPGWLVVLFFVPLINLLFFLILCLLPSPGPAPSVPGPRFLDRLIPASRAGSAAAGALLASLAALALVALGVKIFQQYGWGLFVGLPFAMGFASALVYGYHAPRSLGACIGVGWLAVAIAGALLVSMAVEGMVCLVMAAPLALVLAAMGSTVGYLIQSHPPQARTAAPPLLLALLLACPSLMWGEYAIDSPPPLLPVRTSIEISAPPDVVWRHVVAFAALPEPDEWFFHLGIAYPTRARIDGAGVGSVRHCIFSTGEFVEPIEVWDEPRLLKFSVASQPAPLREWTPYAEIHPPHLDHYLLSRQGQFLLTALPGGRTRLEGTTWYENRMWPAGYWRPWSDWIIHRIHRRVLEHLQRLST